MEFESEFSLLDLEKRKINLAIFKTDQYEPFSKTICLAGVVLDVVAFLVKRGDFRAETDKPVEVHC